MKESKNLHIEVTEFGCYCKELDMEFDTTDEACNYIDEIYYNEDNEE